MSPSDNADYWRERGRSNLIRQQLEIAEEAVAAVAKRRVPAVAISGPPGIGKTRIAKAVVKKHGLCARISDPNSNVGLLDELYQAGTGVLLLDDTDRFLTAETVNTLKKAIDPNPANRVLVNNIKGKGQSGSKDHTSGIPFTVRCGIIILSNKNLQFAEQWSKSIRPHLSAITSRMPTYTISDDLLTMWEYTSYLGVCENLLRKNHYNLALANQALEYMTKTMWMAGDASPRRLEEVAKTIHLHPKTWRKVLDLRLPPESKWLAGEVPLIPQIIRRVGERAD